MLSVETPVTVSSPAAVTVGTAPRAARRAARYPAWGERTSRGVVAAGGDDGFDAVVGEEAALADDDEMLGGEGHLAHQVR